MDELNLSGKFVKGFMTRLFSSLIKKKLNIDSDISIEGIKIWTHDGKMHFHIEADAEVSKADIFSALKKML